jgi:ABC-type glycerol-3-phosphate transport system permease component
MTALETNTAPRREPPSIKKPRRVGRWILFAVMMVVAVVMLYPFWVMIITSLKSEPQFLSGGGFSWLSWSGLTSVIPIGQELLSSTIVCSSSILIILCVGLPAGFAFSKLRFRMSTVVFLVIVSAMMVPLQAILMPEFVNVTRLHLTGGYAGAVLVYAALGTPFSVFLFTTYFRGVPDELIEAGIVDGLGYFGRSPCRRSRPSPSCSSSRSGTTSWSDCSSSRTRRRDRSPSGSRSWPPGGRRRSRR